MAIPQNPQILAKLFIEKFDQNPKLAGLQFDTTNRITMREFVDELFVEHAPDEFTNTPRLEIILKSITDHNNIPARIHRDNIETYTKAHVREFKKLLEQTLKKINLD